jgi:hypothetical protein
MIKKVKKVLKQLKPSELYGTDEIMEMGVIVNTKLEPSSFTLYRLIKSGKIPALNMGTGKASRYFVKGADLRQYLKDTYKL